LAVKGEIMPMFFADCLNNLQELHTDVEKVLDELPPEALNWSPKEGVNSITALVVHIAGAERFLFGEVLAQEPFARDREAEFRAHDLSAAELKGRLTASRAYVAGVLERLSVADLDSPRRFRTREVTVGWVLGHALKHTATHLGNIQVMRDLWNAR
jgi:uncharacterized damage-inducible protein DinB